MYFYFYINLIVFWPSWLGAEKYTNCIPVEGKDYPNECPGYDTKQSDDKDPVILEFGGLRSTPLLPSLPGPLWLGVIAPDRVQFMGQSELNSDFMLN